MCIYILFILNNCFEYIIFGRNMMFEITRADLIISCLKRAVCSLACVHHCVQIVDNLRHKQYRLMGKVNVSRVTVGVMS